jgi:ppGpp synthetase/RelA/SpoT-type nucleotidyltranferase
MHKLMKRMERINQFVQQYVEDRSKYTDLARTLENSLRIIVGRLGISAHVSSRVKEADTVREKIIRKNYTEFQRQLQDLVGVRVVTLYDCDVDRFVRAFLDDFDKGGVAEVLHKDSSNKKSQLRPNEFGYLSSHVVFKIATDINPWGSFGGMFAELQVRSTLQNGWADVSHSMDYKGSHFAPPPIRRRLHAISALLEVADNDFDRMRAELDEMAKQYQDTVRRRKFERLSIDALSVSLYLKSKHFDGMAKGGLQRLTDIGRTAGMSDWTARPRNPIDGTALSRLVLTLTELDIRRLSDFDELLQRVLKKAAATLNKFMRSLVALEGVFHADPVDILTVLVTADAGTHTTARGFRRDFDWSGPFLSRPTKEVLAALREIANLAGSS